MGISAGMGSVEYGGAATTSPEPVGGIGRMHQYIAQLDDAIGQLTDRISAVTGPARVKEDPRSEATLAVGSPTTSLFEDLLAQLHNRVVAVRELSDRVVL